MNTTPTLTTAQKSTILGDNRIRIKIRTSYRSGAYIATAEHGGRLYTSSSTQSEAVAVERTAVKAYRNNPEFSYASAQNFGITLTCVLNWSPATNESGLYIATWDPHPETR